MLTILQMRFYQNSYHFVPPTHDLFLLYYVKMPATQAVGAVLTSRRRPDVNCARAGGVHGVTVPGRRLDGGDGVGGPGFSGGETFSMTPLTCFDSIMKWIVFVQRGPRVALR